MNTKDTKVTLAEKILLIIYGTISVCGLILIIFSAIVTIKHNLEAPTVTFDSQWMESFAEENGEDVIYWEIDWVGDRACRMYEYTTHLKQKIHIYYECEDYSSGFDVVMNPETGRCTIWESGH